MAFSVGDIIQITQFGTYVSQQCLNVFFYRVVTPQVVYTPATVTDQFMSDVWANLDNVISSAYTANSIELRNLTNEIDIFSKAYNLAGLVTGEALPPYAAFGFRLNRSTAVTRHGQKRFVGVPETLQAMGTVTSAALTTLDALAHFFSDDLVEVAQGDANFVFEPVIVGRTLNSEGKYELDLSKINPVGSCQFVSLTTQNTRKFGRGN